MLANNYLKEEKTPKLGMKGSKIVNKLSPKHIKKETKSSTALCEVITKVFFYSIWLNLIFVNFRFIPMN